MNDFLKQLCIHQGIKLIYTNNKFTILSSGVQKNIPTLRVHKIFKDCPKKIAHVIINYYLKYPEYKDEFIIQLKSYAKKYLVSIDDYKIAPLNKKFKKAIEASNKSLNENNSLNSGLIEYDILSIIQKNLSHKKESIISNNEIILIEDNVIDLDILVE